MKIWILDDNQSDVKNTRYLLELMGFNDTTGFYCPVKFMELIQSFNSELPEVLIIEKEMPTMSGWQVVKWISENIKEYNPKVFIVSAYIYAFDHALKNNFEFEIHVSEKPFSYQLFSEIKTI